MAELRWTAQPRQRAFLKATETEVLYGGASGGGKSDALLIDLIRTCATVKGAKCGYIRKTFADMAKPGAAIGRSHELLDGTSAHWRGDGHTWAFPNKSIFAFGHLQNEKDVYNYQSSQFDRLAFDELTQLTEFEFRYLEARARATVRGVMPKIRAGTNPGNVGHGWVKATWIDAAPWDSRFDLPEVNGQSPGTGRFIPSKVDDNQELLARDPGYKDRLNLLPDSIREAYRDGSWDLFVGQFFTEFNRDRHVCKPFAIPRAWPRWIAVDYGYGAPWCVLWLARDPATRQTVVYRELYQTNVIDRVQPTKILAAMAGERCEAAYADPSMWNTQPNGTSIAQVYHAGHVPIAKANNDRKAGWQRVREALGDDDEGRPRLQIFETCLNLIRTLPVQVYDPHDSEDLDTEGEDHPEDVLRYALMGASVPAAQKTRVSFGG